MRGHQNNVCVWEDLVVGELCAAVMSLNHLHTSAACTSSPVTMCMCKALVVGELSAVALSLIQLHGQWMCK